MSKNLTDGQVETVLDLSNVFRRSFRELAKFMDSMIKSLDPLFQGITDEFNEMTLKEYKSMSREERNYVLKMTKKLRAAGYNVKGMPPEPEADLRANEMHDNRVAEIKERLQGGDNEKVRSEPCDQFDPEFPGMS